MISSPNLVSQIASLTHLNDDQLKSYISDKSNPLSPFALATLQSKTIARKKFGTPEAPKQTVADQVEAEADAPLGGQGLAGLQAQQPQMPPQGAPMAPPPQQVAMLPQAPQGMAGGGMVAFDEGGVASLPLRDDMYNEDSFAHGGIVNFVSRGLVPDPYEGLTKEQYDALSPQDKYAVASRNKLRDNPYYVAPMALDNKVAAEQMLAHPAQTEEQLFAKSDARRTARGINDDLYDTQQADVTKEKEGLAGLKDTAFWTRMLQGSIGTMGGTSQNPFTNIATGAMPALQGYGTDIKDIRAEEKGLRKEGNEIARALQASKEARLAGDVASADKYTAEANRLIQLQETNKNAGITAQNAALQEANKLEAKHQSDLLDYAKGIKAAELSNPTDKGSARLVATQQAIQTAKENARKEFLKSSLGERYQNAVSMPPEKRSDIQKDVVKRGDEELQKSYAELKTTMGSSVNSMLAPYFAQSAIDAMWGVNSTTKASSTSKVKFLGYEEG